MYSDIPLEISRMDVKGNVASSDRLRLQNKSLNSGLVHGLPLKCSSFGKLKHFHRGSVIIPLLKLPKIHGLLLKLRHRTAKISFRA